MEQKKTEKANLENRRLIFTEIGLAVALLLVWGAFSYGTKEKTVQMFDTGDEVVEVEDMVPITQETPPPPPEAPQIPVLSDQIDIVTYGLYIVRALIDAGAAEGAAVVYYDRMRALYLNGLDRTVPNASVAVAAVVYLCVNRLFDHMIPPLAMGTDPLAKTSGGRGSVPAAKLHTVSVVNFNMQAVSCDIL